MHQILEQFQPAPRAMNILFLSISQRKIVAKPNLVLLTLQHFSPNDATLNGIFVTNPGIERGTAIGDFP